MAAPAPQQTATSYGESMLTSNAPPAYIEKQPLGEGQAPAQQQGGQLLQGQYPQQVQITGGVLPQTWPQGYPVSHCHCILANRSYVQYCTIFRALETYHTYDTVTVLG